MLQFSTGTRQQLPPQLFEQMGQYRREVFINRLGWKLNTINGMELDEFDGPDAVYVCSHDDDGNVNGVARLLPTTAPYLMEKEFSQLWAGQELPRDTKIWELSRFSAMGSSSGASIAYQPSARDAPCLLKKVMRISIKQGARTLVTVSPVGMERLLRINGFRVMRAGVPKAHQNSFIVALQIDCEKTISGKFFTTHLNSSIDE